MVTVRAADAETNAARSTFDSTADAESVAGFGLAEAAGVGLETAGR
jgi:hypothetical protein